MSAPLRDLTVDSVTGIDVSLPVAGPGARAYAFLLDWHIRLIVALAWFVVGALLYNGRPSLAPPLSNDARWFGTVVAPALAIYFLYHCVLELAMRGSTPGWTPRCRGRGDCRGAPRALVDAHPGGAAAPGAAGARALWRR